MLQGCEKLGSTKLKSDKRVREPSNSAPSRISPSSPADEEPGHGKNPIEPAPDRPADIQEPAEPDLPENPAPAPSPSEPETPSEETEPGKIPPPPIPEVVDAPEPGEVVENPSIDIAADEPLDGQQHFSYSLPPVTCAQDGTPAEPLQACQARRPSPIGNVVLDVGHDDSAKGKRHSNHKDIHEGKNNMAVTLMAKARLVECYGVPPENILLSRYPGETKFGEYLNSQAAKKVYSQGRIKDTAAWSSGDGKSRARHIESLMTANGKQKEGAIFVSVHHNAAAADYPAALVPSSKYGSHGARQNDIDFAQSFLTEVHKDFAPIYKDIASALPKSHRFHKDTQNRNTTIPSVRQLDSAKNDQIGGIWARSLSVFNVSKNRSKGPAMILTEATFMDAQVAAYTQRDMTAADRQIASLKSSGNTTEAAQLKKQNYVTASTKTWNAKTKQWETGKSYDYHAPKTFQLYAKSVSESIAKQMMKQCGA